MSMSLTEDARPNRVSASSAGQETTSPEIAQVTLENGLSVIVLPDRRTTAVAHMVWYKHGGADDPQAKSGLAHFVEHLMFKGTDRFSIDEFQKRLTSVGGGFNAFTNCNFTCFLEVIPPNQLAYCMDFEADRMQGLKLDDEAVRNEREIVLAERGMNVESDPGAVLSEALIAACFGPTPIGRPVIGWRHEIESYTRDDVLSYYRRFYTPENAIVIISGDVETEEVISLAKTYYGPLQPQPTPEPRVRATRPALPPEQRISMTSAAVQLPEIRKLFRVPAPDSDQKLSAALELIALYLSGSGTNRLHQRLVVEETIAARIGASYWEDVFQGTTIFVVAGHPAPGVTLEALERAIDLELRELIANGISEIDLARCKKQLYAQAVFANDDPFTFARFVGARLCFGIKAEDCLNWHDHIRSLTETDIRRAVQFLDPKAATSGWLVPEQASEAAAGN